MTHMMSLLISLDLKYYAKNEQLCILLAIILFSQSANMNPFLAPFKLTDN